MVCLLKLSERLTPFLRTVLVTLFFCLTDWTIGEKRAAYMALPIRRGVRRREWRNASTGSSSGAAETYARGGL